MINRRQAERRETSRASAARMLFAARSVAFEELDEHQWRVGPGYLFWPASGLWRRPDGSPGNGAHALVQAIARENPVEPPAA